MRWGREWGIERRRGRRSSENPEAREISEWIETSTAQLRGEDDTPDYNPYLPADVPSEQGGTAPEPTAGNTSSASSPWGTPPGLPPRKKRSRSKREAGSTAARSKRSSARGAKGSRKRASVAAGAHGSAANADPSASQTPGQPAPAGATPASSRTGSHAGKAGSGSVKMGRAIGFAAVIVVVAVAAAVFLGNRGYSSDLPQASEVEADTIELEPIWSARLSMVAWGDVNGPRTFGDYAAIAPETVVVLTRPDYDNPANAAVGLNRDSGRREWTLTLEDILCAQRSTTSPSGEDILMCTGVRDGDQVLLQVRTSDGEELREVEVDHPVAALTTVGDAVVLMGQATAEATLPLSWYAADGTKVWQEELTDLSPELADDLLDSDGVPEVWNVEWGAAPEMALVQVNYNAFRLTPQGATWIERCSSGMLLQDGYICDDYPPVRYDVDGEPVWEMDDWSLIWGRQWLVDTLLVEDYDSGDTVVAAADPASGAVAEELMRTDSYLTQVGTEEVPLLLSKYELVRFAPGGDRVEWARPYDREEWGGQVTVAGDRVLLPHNGATWGTVIVDADTGAEIARTALANPLVVQDRLVLEERSNVLSLYELP